VLHRFSRSIHGIPLEVVCDAEDAAALAAHRLAGFPDAAEEAELIVEVTTLGRLPEARRPADARVVHETAHAAVRYSDERDELWLEYGAQGVACCRAGEGRAWVAVDRASERWPWIATRPLLTICLLELLKRRSLYGIHAAAAALKSRAVLAFGPSGSGKSTISLSLLLAGWSFLGDDIVFLRQAQAGVEVLAFPEDIDASDETIGFFPGLGPPGDWPQLPGYSKRQISPVGLADAPPAAAARPYVAVLPRVTGAEAPSRERVGPDALLLELVPNVLFTDGDATQSNLEILARLAQQVSASRLLLGGRTEVLPRLLEGLLEETDSGR
jgi:hypothetical protein